MRRKDLRYYFKTVGLRLKSKAFAKQKATPHFRKQLEKSREEYRTKLQETELVFTDFQLYFHSYFYLKDTCIFEGIYEHESGYPIALKGGMRSPLLPIYYGLVKNNQSLLEGTSFDPVMDKIALFIEDHYNKQDNSLKLYYQTDFHLFDLDAPWLAGITQALATSFLCRIHYQYNEEKYINLAESAFKICLISVEEGGLLRATNKGLEWVEEYPSSPASHVLNGHMFAIIAAIELFQLTANEMYYFKAKEWINSLIIHLPEYQYKEYLLHNKRQEKLSNVEYQGLYVGLFKHLYELTRHPLFKEFYDYYNHSVDWSAVKRFYGMTT